MGHQDPGGSHHPHQVEGVDGLLVLQRGPLHRHQGIDGHALWMGLDVGEHFQQARPIAGPFPHADDSTAAEGDARSTHPGQGFQPFLIGAGGDDLVVVLGAGIQVVVVGGQSRVG